MGSHVRKSQGGDHKDDGYGRGHLAEEGAGAAASEDRLTGASEGRAHARPFAGLQQDDEDQDNADKDVDDR